MRNPGASMRPTECPECGPYFTFSIQAEARMVLLREGKRAAQAFVDEKLEDVHSEHAVEPNR